MQVTGAGHKWPPPGQPLKFSGVATEVGVNRIRPHHEPVR
jgi:hypothetical protein